MGVSGGLAVPAAAVEAVRVTPQNVAIDLTPMIERYRSDGDLIQISTAPGKDGIVRRIVVKARETGARPDWMVFALSNNTDEQVDRLIVVAAELVDERADQPLLGLVECRDEVGAALGAINLLVDTLEHALNLLVEFSAVGDQKDAVGSVLFTDPLGQPHHRQALAGALRVPDQALLLGPLGDPVHRLVDGPELLIAADLLNPPPAVGIGLEDNEMCQQVQQPRRLQQRLCPVAQ